MFKLWLYMQLLFMQLIANWYMIGKNLPKTPSKNLLKIRQKSMAKICFGFVGSSRALTKD